MITVGQHFPKTIALKKVESGVIQDFSTEELAKGRCILFAVPGAFTPTCSIQHLPSYIRKRDDLKAKNVDYVFCLAVNDPFVLQAWAKEHDITDDRIIFLADGSALLTKALGMELDLTSLGLGVRSKRYVMVIDDGIVTHLFVEENAGVCELSSADSLFEKI